MEEIRIQPKQAGKTVAMYDQLVATWREFEERAEAERLILVCHPDEYDRTRALLDAALDRQFMPRRVTLLASEVALKGSVIAYEQRHLPAYLRTPTTRYPADGTSAP